MWTKSGINPDLEHIYNVIPTCLGTQAGLCPAIEVTMQWVKKRLLVWGTTYPEFSKKYFETVCTGALDEETGKLIRIYPLTLRHIENPPGKYSWIVAEIARNTADPRPESYRINQQTIEIVGHLDTKDRWLARKEQVLRPGNVFQSVNALLAAEAADGTSLGLVQPGRVVRAYARRRTKQEHADWIKQRDAALANRDLFVDVDSKVKDLVMPGVEYRLEWVCSDHACSIQHDMSILDWGTYVLSRKLYAARGASIAEDKVIEKIEEYLNLVKNEPYLFLGNSQKHPKSFMIVGVFHPPKPRPERGAEPPAQLSLPGAL